MSSCIPAPVSITVPSSPESLAADLCVPPGARGLVIFAHGSGSSRHSPRNQAVARTLQAEGLATLLADLLTIREERADALDLSLRFDIELLGRRVIDLVDWAGRQPGIQALPVGLFGASTGAAAALVAAAARPDDVAAVVSRGGRPDLAGAALPQVEAPTLLIVGGRDAEVIELNRWAMARMQCAASLEIVPGATHLFEEAGTLDRVASAASEWFCAHMPTSRAAVTQKPVT